MEQYLTDYLGNSTTSGLKRRPLVGAKVTRHCYTVHSNTQSFKLNMIKATSQRITTSWYIALIWVSTVFSDHYWYLVFMLLFQSEKLLVVTFLQILSLCFSGISRGRGQFTVHLHLRHLVLQLVCRQLGAYNLEKEFVLLQCGYMIDILIFMRFHKNFMDLFSYSKF